MHEVPPLQKAKSEVILSFIYRCEWNGDDCGPETFERILTDHGVCYQFTENSTQLMVSSSGKPETKTITALNYGLM